MSEATLDIKRKVETAFRGVLEQFQESDLSGWKVVWRFFGRRVKTPVISVVCMGVSVAQRGEDGTPLLFDAVVSVSARSHQRDEESDEHAAWQTLRKTPELKNHPRGDYVAAALI